MRVCQKKPFQEKQNESQSCSECCWWKGEIVPRRKRQEMSPSAITVVRDEKPPREAKPSARSCGIIFAPSTTSQSQVAPQVGRGTLLPERIPAAGASRHLQATVSSSVRFAPPLLLLHPARQRDQRAEPSPINLPGFSGVSIRNMIQTQCRVVADPDARYMNEHVHGDLFRT